MQAKKSLGQHFLMHARIAERIAITADLSSGDVVFEIGPGTGKLTQTLLKRAKKVIAIETDSALADALQKTFAIEIEKGKLELVRGDIQGFAIEHLPKGYKLVANIPYYLTGDILRKFLSSANQPSSMTLLVQKEVAERIARSNPDVQQSGPRPKRRGKESLLSLSVKAYGVPKYEFTVPKGAFVPAPKVDSAVLSIRGISRRNFTSQKDEERFFEIIHAGFAQKRKQLGGNLKKVGITLPPALFKKRAEDLTLADWQALVK